jgi:hypothetical protein
MVIFSLSLTAFMFACKCLRSGLYKSAMVGGDQSLSVCDSEQD